MIEATAPDRKQRTAGSVLRLMVPLMLVLFISNLDTTVVATAIPSIGRSLHNLADAPWIATSYLLTSAVTTLVLGKLGDMYGRKPVFQFLHRGVPGRIGAVRDRGQHAVAGAVPRPAGHRRRRPELPGHGHHR
jgi:hypothetical protein